MNNFRKIFPLILFIAVAGLFVTVLLPDWTRNSTPSPSPLEQSINETAVIISEIDFDNGETIQVTLEETDLSAFDALQQTAEIMNYDLQTQQYDFGVFVQSINGYESTAEKSWLYFVNGESGTVAADQMQLQPGDTVSWRYLEPTEQ